MARGIDSFVPEVKLAVGRSQELAVEGAACVVVLEAGVADVAGASGVLAYSGRQ